MLGHCTYLLKLPGHLLTQNLSDIFLPPSLTKSTLWQRFKVGIKKQQQEMNCFTVLLLFAEALYCFWTPLQWNWFRGFNKAEEFVVALFIWCNPLILNIYTKLDNSLRKAALQASIFEWAFPSSSDKVTEPFSIIILFLFLAHTHTHTKILYNYYIA